MEGFFATGLAREGLIGIIIAALAIVVIGLARYVKDQWDKRDVQVREDSKAFREIIAQNDRTNSAVASAMNDRNRVSAEGSLRLERLERGVSDLTQTTGQLRDAVTALNSSVTNLSVIVSRLQGRR